MPVPYLLHNGSKIAPFKYGNNLPYGAFINTTKAEDYPVKQNIRINNTSYNFVWPSLEHAYHAQKIIHLMRKNPNNWGMQRILIDTLRKMEGIKASPGEVFLPRNDWDPIVTDLTKKYPHIFGANKASFDVLCDSNYHSINNPSGGLMPNGEPHTLNFMREVMKLKLEQYPALKQLAIDCAREGILPIEVSQYDFNWASGPDGTGANMLGIVILELGNQFLKEKDPLTQPLILNPKSYYQQLQRQNLKQLSHDSLVPYTASMNGWTQSVASTLTGQETQYYQSTGGNKRLVIQHNKIIGYEYRDNPSAAWKKSGDPSRFSELITKFNQGEISQDMQYYQSTGGNKRLVIQQNKIVGYEYRDNPSAAWKKSGDPSRFSELITKFNQGEISQDMQYYQSTGGNKRLVIQQNKIVGYEYRDNPSAPWKKSGDPSRFSDLITKFNQGEISQDMQYYQKDGGNKRLMIQHNKIIGYEYRDNPSAAWKKSGDPSRFSDLITEFNKGEISQDTQYSQKENLEQEKQLREQQRLEQEKKLREEQQRLEQEKKLREEQQRLEQEKKLGEEQQHPEQEKQLSEEQQRRKMFISSIEQKIDVILNGLSGKIGEIDQHHFKEARDTAKRLLEALQNAKLTYIANLNNLHVSIKSANTEFERTCDVLINDAKTVLERDLGWGDYLTNLLKTIVNAVIGAFTFGQVSSLFTPSKAESVIAVEEAQTKLTKLE